jgi:hypothetical protein
LRGMRLVAGGLVFSGGQTFFRRAGEAEQKGKVGLSLRLPAPNVA